MPLNKKKHSHLGSLTINIYLTALCAAPKPQHAGITSAIESMIFLENMELFDKNERFKSNDGFRTLIWDGLSFLERNKEEPPSKIQADIIASFAYSSEVLKPMEMGIKCELISQEIAEKIPKICKGFIEADGPIKTLDLLLERLDNHERLRLALSGENLYGVMIVH